MEEIKEFLKTNTDINPYSIAHKMWPKNKAAHVYLSRKISDKADRPFTKKDAELALKVLNELANSIRSLKI
jgi:hypothetical protein